MFEFNQHRAAEKSAAIRPSEKIDFANGIRKRSLLIWSEHCVECAAPECYQTCDLYNPRPDQRCRRFEVGMRRNNHFRGQTGSAADIVFGQWAKLEARGNTVLWHSSTVSIVESMLPRLQPLVDAVGRLVRRFGGSAPWTSLSFELLDYTSKRLHKASTQNTSTENEKPDGFLIEIYNPAEHTCKVKFACAVTRSKALTIPPNGKLALPYWEQLVLVPGYNRHFIPFSRLSAIAESRLPYNISFTPEEESGTRLVFISTDFITVDDPDTMMPAPLDSTAVKPAAKCVVFDLDNTLWEGVLLEGDVSLKPSVPALFESLDKRGILITVASKNNEQQALDRLTEFGLAQYLIYPVINWKQKSENIKWLADKISISSDTLIFVDDSAFEREEVVTSVAGVEVLPETALDTLLEHPRLQGGRTSESRNRRIMYQQQAQRSEAAIEFGEDYLSFLKSSDIVVTIGPMADHHRERVIELLQRTNQLNFSGTKYSREAVGTLLHDTSTDKHVIHCRDKYGDYGLVGFSITRVERAGAAQGSVRVQDFMLSCRVQGKLIEKAYFSYLADKYSDGTLLLDVNFVSTDRNALARSVLQEIGFSIGKDSGADDKTGVIGSATLAVTPGQLDIDFLELRSNTAAEG